MSLAPTRPVDDPQSPTVPHVSSKPARLPSRRSQRSPVMAFESLENRSRQIQPLPSDNRPPHWQDDDVNSFVPHRENAPRHCSSTADAASAGLAPPPALDEMSIDLLFQDVSDLLGSLETAEAIRAPRMTAAACAGRMGEFLGDWSADPEDESNPLVRQIDDVLQLLNDDSLVF